jgi:hypothetical protein
MTSIDLIAGADKPGWPDIHRAALKERRADRNWHRNALDQIRHEPSVHERKAGDNGGKQTEKGKRRG